MRDPLGVEGYNPQVALPRRFVAALVHREALLSGFSLYRLTLGVSTAPAGPNSPCSPGQRSTQPPRRSSPDAGPRLGGRGSIDLRSARVPRAARAPLGH